MQSTLENKGKNEKRQGKYIGKGCHRTAGKARERKAENTV